MKNKQIRVATILIAVGLIMMGIGYIVGQFLANNF